MQQILYRSLYFLLFFSIITHEIFAGTVLITGASRGIGYALTKQLLEEDLRVIAIVRNKESLTSLTAKYPRIQVIEFDLSNLDMIDTIVKDIQESKIDYIVHNAAIIEPIGSKALLEAPIPSLRRVLEINLLAPILLTASLQSKLGHGTRILNISSGAGDKAFKGLGIYCVSKAGIDMYTQSLQLDRPHGVLCASVHPGVVDTNMQKELRNSNAEEFPLADLFKNIYREGKLISADDSAKYLKHLLLKTTDEDFVKNKHYN